MEWIETTAKSIEEAKDLALDNLGVDEGEAEFEVVEEPRQGLFGRTRGQARVRARVVPKTPRAKDERRDRKRRPKGGGRSKGGNGGGNRNSGGGSSGGGNGGGGNAAGGQSSGRQSGGGQNPKDSNRSDSNNNRGGRGGRPRADRPKVEDAPMEDVQACVEEFLTGLTAAFGIDTTVEIETENEYMTAHIQGKHGLLLGPKARTLDAIQELTRVTAQRATPSSTRIKVDVGGYREARKEALAGFALKAAERAKEEQVEVVLEPMNSADRKVVHDTLNEVDGVGTRSAGNDPNRRVVVVPDVTDQEPSVDDEPAGTDNDEATGPVADD